MLENMIEQDTPETLGRTQVRTSKTRPLRILHVVGGMTRGGIETWLMHILRHTDRQQLQMDFLVHTRQPCSYDPEVLALGSRLICCDSVGQPLKYARQIRKILDATGPYDVVHSHVHHFSGFVLRIAKQAGVPVRISHSHIDTSAVEAIASPLRRLYLILMRRWIQRYATLGFGCSQDAAANLFGDRWMQDERWQTLYYGIDLEPFQRQYNAQALRSALGIPPDAVVIGHIGRFVEQKNHAFLLKIAADLARKQPRLHLLLVGEGVLQKTIRQEVARLGLTNQTTFAGVRPDIPDLLKGVVDAFVFPSLFEGLGIVLIEAQAAGLPCFISDNIPLEADVVPSLVHRLSLSQSAAEWVSQIQAVLSHPAAISAQHALEIVQNSPFNINRSAQQLQEIYLKQTEGAIANGD